jgi:hypothetical protein
MRKFLSIYREIRRSSDQTIDPRQALELAEQILDLYAKDQFVNENDWGGEQEDECQLTPVDEFLCHEPGALMKHERMLLEDVYEDDPFFQKPIRERISYEWAVI